MTWRTALFALCLIGGPFITVGSTVFYRRALEWWYENPIGLSHDAAFTISIVVLAGIALTLFISFLMWEASSGYNNEKPKRWWWEKPAA